MKYPSVAEILNQTFLLKGNPEQSLWVEARYEPDIDCVINGTCQNHYVIGLRVIKGDINYVRKLFPQTNGESSEEILIGGYDAVLYKPNPAGQEGGRAQNAFMKKGDYIYYFYFAAGAYSPAGTFENKRPLFDKFLSTFKFIEKDETEVIRYIPKEAPDEIYEGSCWINALSTMRKDAWRCSVGNYIKDPCFIFEANKSLVCEPYPPTGDKGVLLKLTETLPEPDITEDKLGEGWAWLIELEDGSICRFITGATAIVNGKRINFSCGKTEITILGDLQVGQVWKAEKAVLEYVEGKWQAKSVELVPIKRVWQ